MKSNNQNTVRNITDTLPEAPPWLKQFGFNYHPFSFPEAEDMPPWSLEETFVAHPGFDEYIRDFEFSAVLLAPPGSGKTASRLRLASALNRQQHNAFAEQTSEKKTTDAPLVVVYDDFQEVVKALPDVGLQDHARSLLSAMAEAIYNFIAAYPDQFLALDNRIQDWWWGFLEEHLRGEKLKFRLQESTRLDDSWQDGSNYAYPFHPETTLQDILTSLRRQLNILGINKIFVLVDGVDVHIKTEALSDLKNLVEDLLNILPLLPLPDVIWKFFLPHSLERAVYRSNGYTTGRLRVVPVNWDDASLMEFLALRLRWASDGRIGSLINLCDMELSGRYKVDVDRDLVQMALQHDQLGPPRALLELGRQLLQKLVKGILISWEDWNEFKAQVQQSFYSIEFADDFPRIEKGLKKLRNKQKQMGDEHRQEFDHLQSLLLSNIADTKRTGDAEELKKERQNLIKRLDILGFIYYSGQAFEALSGGQS